MGVKQMKKKCVALLARNHGLAALEYLTKPESPVTITKVFTHRYEPNTNVERKEYRAFSSFCRQNGIVLYACDSRKDFWILDEVIGGRCSTDYCHQQDHRVEACPNRMPAGTYDFDFLLSISWKYKVLSHHLAKAKIGAVNIHRGDLPKYKGLEPIKQALLNGDGQIAVCAHIMTEIIDAGEIIARSLHPVGDRSKENLEQTINRLKTEITPLFEPLAEKAFKKLMGRLVEQ